jgi:NAD-dependent dihydropyrimidine dehydrogenase PreA subunit
MGLDTISIRLDACNQCPWGSLQSTIENQLFTAKQIASPWEFAENLKSILDGDPLDDVERPLWNAENPPVSRRDLFRLSSYIAQPEILQSLSSEQSEIGNQRLSSDRRRTIAAIAHFPEIEPDAEVPILDVIGFYELSISEECTACGVCARACPTKALDFRTKNNRNFWLNFTPQACIACDICAHICPQNAVTFNSKPTFDFLFRKETPVSLFEGDLTRCQKCNALMNARSSSKFCSICDFRRKNPFGSVLPPGYKAPPTIDQPDENKP